MEGAKFAGICSDDGAGQVEIKESINGMEKVVFIQEVCRKMSSVRTDSQNFKPLNPNTLNPDAENSDMKVPCMENPYVENPYVENPYVQYMYSYPHKTAYRTLKGVSLREYAPLLKGAGHGLYLHIPFCGTKCGYCNLFSVTGQGNGAVDRYLEAVERQCGQYEKLLTPQNTEFSALTIGLSLIHI